MNHVLPEPGMVLGQELLIVGLEAEELGEARDEEAWSPPIVTIAYSAVQCSADRAWHGSRRRGGRGGPKRRPPRPCTSAGPLRPGSCLHDLTSFDDVADDGHESPVILH